VSTQNQPWCPRYAADELAGPTMTLTCDEFGLLQRLRDYSWKNGGIPNDEELLKKLGKTFLISAYKFKKIWPRLENFFEIRDGLLFYSDDEQERRGQVLNIAKSKLYGKIGAAKRWGNRQAASIDGQPQPDSPPIESPAFSVGENLAAENGYPQSQSHTQVGEPPPPPTPSTDEGGGGGTPLAVDEYQQIAQRALDLGMAAPERRLAVQVRQKFGDRPIAAVLESLVRWEGQEHVGLWATKTADDFDLEAARQQSGGPSRKRSQREQENEVLMARARARTSSGGAS
jgi:hypothetical protein